jgi:hypothetical protein
VGATRRKRTPKLQAEKGNAQVTTTGLAVLQRRYQACRKQLLEVGFIALGSLIQRYTVCANAGCHCHHDPPQRHGPYWQYTRKVDGKTITARLTNEQAERYREWIDNRHKLDQIIAEMDQVSQQARDLLLAQTPKTSRS